MISPRVRRGALVMGTIFFCYLLFCEGFFITHATGGIFRSLSSAVFIPAARVEGRNLSYHAVAEMTHGLRGFGGATSHKEAFHRALELGVYRLYVRDLAAAHDIDVSQDDVAAYPVNQDAIASGLEIAKWDEKKYRKFIVAPLLLAQKTEVAVSADDTYQSEALQAMDSIRKKLAQGMPFADVAQNFSQDVSASARGDFGIMSVSDLPTWLAPSVSLAPGDISEVLSAPDAFWTVTLIEFFPSDVPEQAAVHFRGVATKKKTFGDILGQTMTEHPAWVFVW